MKREVDGIMLSQVTNVFAYFLIPTVLLTLIVAINFQYIKGYEFISGLALVGLFFITLLPGKRKPQKDNELIEVQEKLINAQEEIKKLKAALEEQQQHSAAKDEFFKILAHDIKSPVNCILGLTEVVKLNENHSKEDLLQMIDKMAHSGRNVKMLIDNLLQWYVNCQGKLIPNKEKVRLMEVVEKVQLVYQYIAEEKGITLKSEVASDLYVHMDKDHLFTILRNIVNNALKFTPQGGKVLISTTSNNEFAAISIEDNGNGMKEDIVTVLCDENRNDFKIMQSLVGTRGEVGNGLGLSICTDLVAFNNGKIEISSELNKGTNFTVSLPAFNHSIR